MVKLAIMALTAACLATVVLGQRPAEQSWGGGLVVEDDVSNGRQTTSTTTAADTTTPTLSTLLTNLISNVLAPLLQNIATGITNAITATFANRVLRYIPVPTVPESYRMPSPPRPYGGDDYPSFYREPASRPTPDMRPEHPN